MPASPAALASNLQDKAIELAVGDDQARACRAIPDEACEDAPRNFYLNAANGWCTKLAERLAGQDLVLPGALTAIGAPVARVSRLDDHVW